MAHDKLIALGSNCIDEYYEISDIPQQGSKVMAKLTDRKVGGMIGNAASVYAGYGHPTLMFDYMNPDPVNDELIKDLKHYGVLTDLIERSKRYPLVKCQIMLNKGERIIFVMADTGIKHVLTKKQRTALLNADVLYTTLNDLRQLENYGDSLNIAKQNGLKVFFDIEASSVENGDDLETLLSFGDVLSINEQALDALNQRLGNIIERYRKNTLILVTKGANGSEVYTANDCLKFAAMDLHPIDTTGAGDTYNASFLHGIIQGWPLEKCGRFATAAASRCILSLGARSGVGTENDIWDFLRKEEA